MSKPKHTVFCPECGRSKILFETEKKANLFLQYNADDIAHSNRYGKKPVRSYYCKACGGWHVTSIKENLYKDYSLTDRVVSSYHQDELNKKLILKHITSSPTIKEIVDNFQYIGLFLTNESKDVLKQYIEDNFADMIKDGKMYLDHCTILHCSQKEDKKALRCIDRYIKDCGKDIKETIVINKIGYNNEAMAFGCRINTPCVNPQPHITICTFGNGKPVASNSITNWKDINPIKVKAVIHRV